MPVTDKPSSQEALSQRTQYAKGSLKVLAIVSAMGLVQDDVTVFWCPRTYRGDA